MFDIDLDKYRIVDLSMEVVPPGTVDRPFEIERGYLVDRTFVHKIITHSHVGTHIESPAHFYDGGMDLTGYPLTTFMGRAVLLDIDEASSRKAITPDYLEASLGDIMQKGDIVVVRNTDVASKASGRKEDLPYVTPAAARWLVD